MVSVQLGQCGNQLGEEFFRSLHSEASRARPVLAAAIRRSYFCEQRSSTRQWRARAVLVDTEPRVVHRLTADANQNGSKLPGGWCYGETSTCWRQGGAANNWAYGFCHHGPAMGEEVLEKARAEAEQCDRLEGFLALHSVAGGTGSGVGSYVLQQLRDFFPSTTIAAVSIWPFETGEVSVQSYNAALSLAAIYEYANIALLCENERYLDICRVALQDPNPSLGSLNKAICNALLRSVLPCRAGPSQGGLVCPLLRLSSQLCAHPLYRLVTAHAVPQVSEGARAFVTDSWQGLQRRLVQMCGSGSLADHLPSSSGRGPKLDTANPRGGRDAAALDSVVPVAAPIKVPSSGPSRAVAAAAFLWGTGAAEASLDGLRRLPAWRFALEAPQVHADVHQVGDLERSLGLLSNCRSVIPPLASAGSKASAMLRASAYVHQYERCGVEREDLSQALLQLAQVKSDYERL